MAGRHSAKERFSTTTAFPTLKTSGAAASYSGGSALNAIGGYTPVKGGCIDHIAVVSARMKGWKTRTFTDKVCIHHRAMNTAGQGVLKARFKLGAKDYSFGNHPLWELFRTLYQMRNPPFVLGGLALGAGYFWSMARRAEISVSRDLVAFTHREQLQRLKKFVTRSRSAPPPLSSQNQQQIDRLYKGTFRWR